MLLILLMFAIFGATTQKTKVTIPNIFSNLFIIAQGAYN